MELTLSFPDLVLQNAATKQNLKNSPLRFSITASQNDDCEWSNDYEDIIDFEYTTQGQAFYANR